MRVYIIDHQPIYILGLKHYINQAYHCVAQIDSCQSAEYVDIELIKSSQWLMINIEMYTHDFKNKIAGILSQHKNIKLLGLTDEENTDIIQLINIADFSALLSRNTLVDEIVKMSESLKNNKTYFSPRITEIIYNLREVKTNNNIV